MAMMIKDIIRDFESLVPLSLQESWDHSGLQVGDTNREVTGVLVAVDVTEAVLEEAVERGANLVVTHHPLLFHALKSVTPHSYVERCVTYAIKHDLVLYAAHTNLDNSPIGVNHYWAEQMGLTDVRALEPMSGYHYKMNIYIPRADADSIREALMSSGIGTQGAYSGCSFSVSGMGRFRAEKGANPFAGIEGEWHTEPEECISVLLRRDQLRTARHIVDMVHPYEEPAVDLLPIQHNDPMIGSGIIGTLPEPLTFEELIDRMAAFQPVRNVIHSALRSDKIRTVAYCGGAGAFLMKAAAAAGADLFITGEAKYNDYHDAIDMVPLITLGHYESEELTKKLLNNLLCQKSSTFAVWYSNRCKNPLNYTSR